MSALATSICAIAVLAPGPVAQLEALDKAIHSLEKKMADIAQQRETLSNDLAAIDTDIAATKVRQQAATEKFRRRLRALERLPAGARLALLGSTRALADYLDVSRLLRWVAREDVRLHHRYVRESESLHELEMVLNERKRALEHLDSQSREERDRLSAERRARLDFLAQLSSKKELARQFGEERAEAKRDLLHRVRQLKVPKIQKARFAQNRGRLPWPAAGPVISKFGEKTDNLYGSVVANNGIGIRAPAGATVQAVANGTVVFADWLSGYGQVVIVEHEDDYYTLVAHLAAMAVTAETEVVAGMPLGTVGDTGSLNGTLLYFELRQGITPQDPEPWLKR